MYYVYILHTSRNTFYTGIAADLPKRLRQHYSKGALAAKYMRSCSSFALVYRETVENRSEALKREAEIKQLPRTLKQKLVYR